MTKRVSTQELDRTVVSRIADDIWNRGDLAVVDEVMSVDARYHGPHMPGGNGGRAEWRNAITMYSGAVPDSRVVYDELIATDDTVVGRWSAIAPHTGRLPASIRREGAAPAGATASRRARS
jgi:hypothetical protein